MISGRLIGPTAAKGCRMRGQAGNRIVGAGIAGRWQRLVEVQFDCPCTGLAIVRADSLPTDIRVSLSGGATSGVQFVIGMLQTVQTFSLAGSNWVLEARTAVGDTVSAIVAPEVP